MEKNNNLSNLVQRYYEEGKYKQAEDIIDFAYNNEPTPIADKICLGVVLKAMGKGNYAVAKQFLLKSVHFNAIGIAEDLLAFIKQLEMSSGGSELRAQTRESIANDNDKPTTSRDTAVVENRAMENLKLNSDSKEKTAEKDVKGDEDKCGDNDCCAICLGVHKNKCFVHPCVHSFCFDCIVPWSKEKPDCPLCQQTFKAIMHNIRPSGHYDVYEVKAVQRGVGSAAGAAAQGGEEGKQGLSAATSLRASAPPQPSGPQPAASRREVYCDDLWAIPLPYIGRYRGCSPDYYKNNVDEAARLRDWIYDNLEAALDKDGRHVTSLIDINFLFRHHIASVEFERHMRGYLGDRLEHVVHELLCFALSPFDLEGYKAHTLYSTRTEALKSEGSAKLYTAVKQWLISHTRVWEKHSELKGSRHDVYAKDLWAVPYKHQNQCSSPHVLSHSHRLLSWIEREIDYILDGNRTLIPAAKKRIEQLLPQYHVTSPQFRDAMRQYLGDHTEHFQHELYNYFCSGESMMSYDRDVKYSTRREAWQRLDVANLYKFGGYRYFFPLLK